jgi:hypothetical protein
VEGTRSEEKIIIRVSTVTRRKGEREEGRIRRVRGVREKGGIGREVGGRRGGKVRCGSGEREKGSRGVVRRQPRKQSRNQAGELRSPGSACA